MNKFECPFSKIPNRQCIDECLCSCCEYYYTEGDVEPCASCASIGRDKCNFKQAEYTGKCLPQPHQRC